MTKRRYELLPDDGRKSFGHKAIVEIAANGTETLYSYETPIIKRTKSGKLTRLWGGWSATTGRHIRAFCGLNKAEFLALKYTPKSKDKAAAYSGTLYRQFKEGRIKSYESY